MPFESTFTRLWKRLTREERLSAAAEFWKQPPASLVSVALAIIVAARRLRPQAARRLPAEEQARILASVLEPGETLAGFLIVALHLGERRAILRSFLDALGLPHEDGMLKPEADDVSLAEDAVLKAVRKLAGEFPRGEVELYLNALCLQDPERWGALSRAPDWM